VSPAAGFPAEGRGLGAGAPGHGAEGRGPDVGAPRRGADGRGSGTAGPAVHVDRLVLRVVGLDEGAARTLARYVAEDLDPGVLRSAGNAGLDHLRIEVTAEAADQGRPDLLAGRIASALSRAMARGQRPGRGDGAAVP
jgi:hypothetical protein